MPTTIDEVAAFSAARSYWYPCVAIDEGARQGARENIAHVNTYVARGELELGLQLIGPKSMWLPRCSVTSLPQIALIASILSHLRPNRRSRSGA